MVFAFGNTVNAEDGWCRKLPQKCSVLHGVVGVPLNPLRLNPGNALSTARGRPSPPNECIECTPGQGDWCHWDIRLQVPGGGPTGQKVTRLPMGLCPASVRTSTTMAYDRG